MRFLFILLLLLGYVYLAHILAKYIAERSGWKYNNILLLLLLFGPLLGVLLILLGPKDSERQ